jgi:hypothetical protein
VVEFTPFLGVGFDLVIIWKRVLEMDHKIMLDFPMIGRASKIIIKTNKVDLLIMNIFISNNNPASYKKLIKTPQKNIIL